jgi:hypothetical protein
MSNEANDFIIYAKEDVQIAFEVITATGEILELDYPCWVYYINITDNTNGKYLMVKESNGNLLEINTRNDEKPDNLENWRIVYEDIYDYSTITPNKTWYIEHGIPCPEGDGTGCFCYMMTTTIKVGNIRIFNGKEYYELLTENPQYPQQWKVITHVREENGQVFFYVENCDREYLLYDYNLNVGDEVYIVDPLLPYSHETPCEISEEDMNYLYRYKVADIDVIRYDGIPRKRLRLENYHGHYPYGYWVEGIGCMKGITYQISSQLVGTVHQLKDCYELDKLIFENENPQYNWCP